MSTSPKKLVLIDGNAIIHRAYHALPPLTTKKGEIVNAVYGFSSTLLNVLGKFKPDYIIATFDLPGPTFRHEEYKEYKATRVKAADELLSQIPHVKEVVRAFNIPIYEVKGFEADDVIGTIIDQSEKMKNPPEGGIENIIVTGDLDTLQLVSGKTKVYTMRRGITDAVLYGQKEVEDRYGLKPDRLTDFKGLRGDPSDNILGVKGIGEKTATELLKKYRTIENIYKNIDKVIGSVKEKLERDKVQAIQSKNLATINTKVPVKLDLSKAIAHDFNRAKIIGIFQEMEFFSLIKRIPGSNNDPETYENAAKNPLNEAKEFVCNIKDGKNLGEFIKKIKKHEEIAIRLKTFGGKISEREIKGMAINFKAGGANFVPYSPNNFRMIKAVMEDPEIKKVGYDLKTELEVLEKYGIELKGIYFDVMLASYVLNPGSKTELPILVLGELNEEIDEEKKKGQLGLEMDLPEDAAQKTCQLADYIGKLKKIYEEKIAEVSKQQDHNPSGSTYVEPSPFGKGRHNLKGVLEDLEMPLIDVLAQMEMSGIKLNTLIFKGISEKIESRIKNLELGIYKLAGKEFNINSSRQLADILFISLKIPTTDIKKGKTGYSTASAELQKINGHHKIIEKIEEYREIFKLKTTYLDTLPLLADRNSRVHTSFNQAVTATGRLSSSDPNLQNIPIRSDIGQLLRTAFEAEQNWKLISADYSQIDLRVVAHVSGDKKLIETFYKGEDIHRATAAEINKVTLSQVTDKMRRSAKALNFGVIYGMSVFGFAQSAGIDRDEAKKFINEYMEKFQGVADYIRRTKEMAKKNLYVETEIGRRRYIPEINSPNFMVQNAAERMAINMPIQGLSADIVKLAMIKLYEEFKNSNDVHMILQIHDEIIFEVKENIAKVIAPKIKEIMENAYKLKVPLVADIKVGDNWGEM